MKTENVADDVEWKRVETMPKYEASKCGRVRGVVSGKELKQRRTAVGYLYVNLSRADSPSRNAWGNCPVRRVLVHRMVALAWLEREAGRDEVDHVNGDRGDNRVENLRWCERAETKRGVSKRGSEHHSFGKRACEDVRTKQSEAKRGARHFRAKVIDVEEVRRRAASGESQAAIAAAMGCRRTVIGDILRGTHWSVRQGEYVKRNPYRPVAAATEVCV